MSRHPISMRKSGVVRAAFSLSLGLCTGLRAYDVGLNAAEIHEAWVLGQRNDQATSEFLAPYDRQAGGATADSPHVAEVEVLTPFAQVVDRSREHASGGYSEQQAAQEYRHHKDTVLVRVRLMLPSAYPKQGGGPTRAPAPTQEQKDALRPENFWQHFQVNMKQRDRTLPTLSVHSKPIYSSPSNDTPSVIDGATVLLEYDADKVASEPATVEIATPEGETISVSFDLHKLR